MFAFSLSFSFLFPLFHLSPPLSSPFLPVRSLVAVQLGNPARDDGCEVIFSRTLAHAQLLQEWLTAVWSDRQPVCQRRRR
ncbi:hypothetical protein BO86DRAFT_387357 [Aspergillus japonicus CBS 114.51]|uniref:Secreted protein n=1 Tax=Aspergillus japonicus CBS 114.51 TaxID=1448312 RepID=A0A8T8X6Y2_ASPJA|nr:hypothetical protein BO86DRAFT_387357 [Aspergillus japonicus CBS 114.51]RAH83908.1 hypothetical protein BO86DRAFT_387357 [Aspergillus japonicus CBS 114.51]